MARGIQKWTEEAIARLQNEGRGKGRGPTYQPWIRTTEIYSEGRTREFWSKKFGREHQLLSDGEWHLFLMLEWAGNVTDVREQYPLPRDITLEMASELGIAHQYYPGTHVPFVMTLDFLVDIVRDGQPVLQAFSVKTASELEQAYEVELLELARSTCHGMGVEHHLVVSERLPANKVKNLEWMRNGLPGKDEAEPSAGFYESHMSRMTHDIQARRPNESLVDYCTAYDSRFGLAPGGGLQIARMLMASRVLQFDLNNPTPELAPLDTFQLTARPGRLRSMGGQ